jgi:hypothetical protein
VPEGLRNPNAVRSELLGDDARDVSECEASGLETVWLELIEAYEDERACFWCRATPSPVARSCVTVCGGANDMVEEGGGK